MILYPAIDLKDGKAVRLLRGDMEKSTVFNTDPAAQAMDFVNAGCDWLHLVDLNGAFEGEPVNAAPVEAILAQSKTPAQLGGGIRDMATIERWLDKGLARVILGTVAVENPALVREASKAFPGQVAVGIDARNGRVATKGWAEETDVMVTDSGKIIRRRGCCGNYLYRHQSRRGDARAQYRGDCGFGPCRIHSGHSLWWCVITGRFNRAARLRGRFERRHFRPGAL